MIMKIIVALALLMLPAFSDMPNNTDPFPAIQTHSEQPLVALQPTTQHQPSVNAQSLHHIEPTPTTQANNSSSQASKPESQLHSQPKDKKPSQKKVLDIDDPTIRQKFLKAIAAMSDEERAQFEEKLASSSRENYERYQKIRQEHAQKQQEENERLAQQSKVDEVQSVKVRQYTLFTQKAEKYKDVRRGFSESLFEANPSSSQDFRISIALDQEVIIWALIYTIKDGVYSIDSKVEGEQPLKIYIQESNGRQVYRSSFYFKDYLSFFGTANKSYSIRIVNSGSHRLVSLYIANLLESNHISQVMTVEDAADHAERVRSLNSAIVERLLVSQTNMLLQNQNQKTLHTGLDHYYYYNIGEIVLVGLVCVLQVEFVRKLLSDRSVI